MSLFQIAITSVGLSIILVGCGENGTADPDSEGQSVFFTASDPPALDDEDVGDLLNSGDRDHLAICVEDVGDGTSDREVSETELLVRDRIHDAMPDLAEHRDWLWAAGREPVEITAGCGVSHAPWEDDWGEILGVRVENASPYLVHVFIISPDDPVLYVDENAFRRTSEEILAQGKVGVEVTVGLYMTVEESAHEERLQERLGSAMGQYQD